MVVTSLNLHTRYRLLHYSVSECSLIEVGDFGNRFIILAYKDLYGSYTDETNKARDFFKGLSVCRIVTEPCSLLALSSFAGLAVKDYGYD